MFSYEAEKIQNEDGYWDTTHVKVFKNDIVIFEYDRNYQMLNTFCAFKQGDRNFALYSPDYTGTRILDLDNAVDIGGDDPEEGGFCPVEFWVHPSGVSGLIAGCIWGDDWAWHVEHLDLTQVEKGGIIREDIFEYVHLGSKQSLADCIHNSEIYPIDWEDFKDKDYYQDIEVDYQLLTVVRGSTTLKEKNKWGLTN